MNVENLKKSIEFMQTVKKENFSMSYFRRIREDTSHVCNSVGCWVGHSTALDPDGFSKMVSIEGFDTAFYYWSTRYFDLTNDEWIWLFCASWSNNITTNTIEATTKRIEDFIENGLPYNWQEII